MIFLKRALAFFLTLSLLSQQGAYALAPRSDLVRVPEGELKKLKAGRYEVLAFLGSGSQGTVLEARDTETGSLVAIKSFSVKGARAWKDVELAEREIQTLQNLKHSHLPGYLDHFEGEEDGCLYLVMEKIEGDTLVDLSARGKLTLTDVQQFLKDAAQVLIYLGQNAPPVVHRDIKPSNVIRRPDGRFVIVDIGSVTGKLNPRGGSTMVGTPGYAAPEQSWGQASSKSDVYGVGMTALFMLTGRDADEFPRDSSGSLDVSELLTDISASAPLKSLLQKMVEVNIEKRPDPRALALELSLVETSSSLVIPVQNTLPARISWTVTRAGRTPYEFFDENSRVLGLNKKLSLSALFFALSAGAAGWMFTMEMKGTLLAILSSAFFLIRSLFFGFKKIEETMDQDRLLESPFLQYLTVADGEDWDESDPKNRLADLAGLESESSPEFGKESKHNKWVATVLDYFAGEIGNNIENWEAFPHSEVVLDRFVWDAEFLSEVVCDGPNYGLSESLGLILKLTRKLLPLVANEIEILSETSELSLEETEHQVERLREKLVKILQSQRFSCKILTAALTHDKVSSLSQVVKILDITKEFARKKDLESFENVLNRYLSELPTPPLLESGPERQLDSGTPSVKLLQAA